MFSNWQRLSLLAGVGLLLGTPSTPASAQMMGESAGTPSQFRRIEQPWEIKAGVTAAGLGLIGLQLWWFLLSKPRGQQAKARQGIQEVTITVDGGYAPNRIVVNAGQPVRLNFYRRDPNRCLETVLFPDFQIAQDLELHQTTAIEFTPPSPGEYPFTCGMNMFRGVLDVQPGNGIPTADAKIMTQPPGVL